MAYGPNGTVVDSATSTPWDLGYGGDTVTPGATGILGAGGVGGAAGGTQPFSWDSILGIYKDRIAAGANWGQQRYADIGTQYAGQNSAIQANLFKTGMAGTTVAPTMALGVQRAKDAAQNRFNEQAQQQQLGLMGDEAQFMLAANQMAARGGNGMANTGGAQFHPGANAPNPLAPHSFTAYDPGAWGTYDRQFGYNGQIYGGSTPWDMTGPNDPNNPNGWNGGAF